MNEFFKILRKDTVLQWSFWITIVIAVVTTLVIGISYQTLPPFIPLYNHMPWGYARLGKTYELFLLPALILGICCINSLLGIKMLSKNTLLARFLFVTMVSVAFLTLIFVVRVIIDTL